MILIPINLGNPLPVPHTTSKFIQIRRPQRLPSRHSLHRKLIKDTLPLMSALVPKVTHLIF